MDMVIPKLPQLLTTIVGFLLVVWILEKFAWGPILDLLDERRDKIRQSDFAEAEQALRRRRDAQGRLRVEARRDQGHRAREGAGSGQAGRGHRRAASSNRGPQARRGRPARRARQDLEIESQKAQLELRDTVVAMALGAAEKVIGERLDDENHRQLIQEYIDSLGEMPHA